MVGRIYQVFLITNPSTEAVLAGAISILKAGPVTVIAKDINTASAKAGALFTQSGKQEIGDLDEIVVVEAG